MAEKVSRGSGLGLQLRFTSADNEVVPIITGFLDGTSIPWATPQAPLTILGQIDEHTSKFHQTITPTILNPTLEGEQALRMLADKNWEQPQQVSDLPQWWWQYIFRASASATVEYAVAKKAVILPSMASLHLTETIAAHTAKGIEILNAAAPSDLFHLIDFMDQVHFRMENMRNKQNIQEARESGGTEKTNNQAQSIWGATTESWQRLRSNLSLDEVEGIINQLPSLISEHMVVSSICVAEENLTRIGGEEATPFESRLDPMAIKLLLGFKWMEHARTITSYELSDIEQSLLDEQVSFGNLALPMKYSPSTAMELLVQEARVQTPEQMMGLLSTVQELALTDKKLTYPWTLVLLAVRSADPDLVVGVNSLIDTFSSLPAGVRATLTDKAYGRVQLNLATGQIYQTNSDKQSKGNVVVYSSAASRNGKENHLEVSPKVKREPVVIPVDDLVVLRKFGEVGLVTTDVEALLETAFPGEKIYPEGLDSQFHELKEQFGKIPAIDSQRMYLPELAPLESEGELKLGGIFRTEAGLIIVLDDEAICTEVSGQKRPVALLGTLDSELQLQILGTSEDFIGSPRHLILNNMLLKAFCLPEYAFDDGKKNRSVRMETDIFVKNWNARNPSQRLSNRTPQPFIVTELPNSRAKVLLGEE